VQGLNTFSVEAWFRTTSSSGGKIVGFGNSRTGESSSYDRHIYLDSDGQITFGVYPGAARTVSSDSGYNDGSWHHVVGTLGPDGMALYVDGNRVGESADTVSAQDYAGYWRVGGDKLSGWPDSGSSIYLAGDIADVAVYDKVLTLGQIDEHWTASGRESTLSGFPEPAFEFSVDGMDVEFDGTESTDAEGAISDYLWDFGDGSTGDGAIADYRWDFGDGSTGDGATAAHTYGEAGTYTVTLTVTDEDGLTASVSEDVVVEAVNSAPVAAFSAETSGLSMSVDGSGSS